MSSSAVVWLIDVFLIVFDDGGLGHREIRYIRLWIHTQYLLVDQLIVGLAPRFVDNKINIENHHSSFERCEFLQ